ncbi:MAG: ABC transporter permease [Eubacteriales bacterium]|nr:ABC transporter permease [Eubacteriales bacterium]
MLKYTVKRLLLGILVLFGVIVITFMITRVVPSDPVGLLVGENATVAQREAITKELGLDQPILVQFKTYIVNLLHGDLGISLRTKHDVLSDLNSCIPATMELVVYAMLLAIVLGIPLGVISARYKDKLTDHVVRLFTIASISLPTFVVALLLQYIFYGKIGLFPLNGHVETVVLITRVKE